MLASPKSLRLQFGCDWLLSRTVPTLLGWLLENCLEATKNTFRTQEMKSGSVKDCDQIDMERELCMNSSTNVSKRSSEGELFQLTFLTFCSNMRKERILM